MMKWQQTDDLQTSKRQWLGGNGTAYRPSNFPPPLPIALDEPSSLEFAQIAEARDQDFSDLREVRAPIYFVWQSWTNRDAYDSGPLNTICSSEENSVASKSRRSSVDYNVLMQCLLLHGIYGHFICMLTARGHRNRRMLKIFSKLWKQQGAVFLLL